jgi:hypothetical protein
MFVHQKENPQAKVKRTREEMQAALENREKVIKKSPRNDLKRKNKVEKCGAS